MIRPLQGRSGLAAPSTAALFVLLIFLPLRPALAADDETWPQFRIGDRIAIALMGAPRLRDDVHYVSFAGDLGFYPGQPQPEDLEVFMAPDRALLDHFDLNAINLEFLPGDDPTARRLVDTVLAAGGYDLISLANNHALDKGQSILAAEAAHHEESGLTVIGTTDRPVHTWHVGDQRVAIYSLTHYTDVEPDSNEAGAGVAIIDADTLDRLAHETAGHDFRIAFIHLGSLSRFPSPHEMQLVQKVIAAGADLVVCSGSHFVKGFRTVDDTPVLFGTGNHLFSYKGTNTEPVGMHVVAGIGSGGLEQIFAIPFGGDWDQGPYGPLDREATTAFAEKLRVRSNPEAGDYFTDDRTASIFWDELSRLNLKKLQKLEPRHFAYAVRILFARYPLVTWGGTFLVVGGVTLLVRKRALNQRG